MVPECNFILSTGRPCHAAALRGKPFCRAHIKIQSERPAEESCTQPEQVIEVPESLDFSAIQGTLHSILKALGANRITPRRADLLLEGLRMAIDNFHRAADPAMADVHLNSRLAEKAHLPQFPLELSGAPI